jgi:ATP-binding cassette subfamily C (CFTR/MRP) protein 10
LQVAKVQVAVRAAIVSSVFRKALRTRVGNTNESNDNDSKEKDSPAPKKQDEATKFQSTGSVLNLMSTDCDRLANFCPSFHQFWSLPFQIAVALYLLYRQVEYTLGK